MKKILLSSVSLLLFAISVSLFQMSCDNALSAESDNSLGTIQQDKIIYFRCPTADAEDTEIWISSNTGGEAQKLNITLKEHYVINTAGGLSISPDGKIVFFSATLKGGTTHYIYRYDIEDDFLFSVAYEEGIQGFGGVTAF